MSGTFGPELAASLWDSAGLALLVITLGCASRVNIAAQGSTNPERRSTLRLLLAVGASCREHLRRIFRGLHSRHCLAGHVVRNLLQFDLLGAVGKLKARFFGDQQIEQHSHESLTQTRLAVLPV